MPPKFQSTFIPKGPAAPGVMPQPHRVVKVSLFSFIAKLIFGLSILAALGAVGYKYYLAYSISRMGAELEARRQEISNGAVGELIDLNNRITTTEMLLKRHRILSPLFAFLEKETPQTARFTDFDYTMGENGPRLSLAGEARSYAALAAVAEVIYRSEHFVKPNFSNIRLDERGNVAFTLETDVAPLFLSYAESLKGAAPTVTQPAASAVAATSTATSTAPATTTPAQ